MRTRLLPLLLLALAACTPDIIAGGRPLPALLPPVPTGMVRADVVVTPVSADVSRIVLEVRNGATPLGSWQGAVTFDPAVLEIVSHRTPEGDGFRVVNPAAAPGSLRFAAFGATALRDSTAFTLEVRTRRPLAAGDLAVTLEVAGTPEGKRLEAERIARPEIAIRGAR